MGHTHGAGGGPEAHAGDRRRLSIALAIAVATLALEAWGALFTGSLALLADATHVLSDGAALGLALFALWLAGRPHTLQETFGYHRAEVLAASLNALALLAIAVLLTWQAFARLANPPEVSGEGLLVIALIGLAANAAQAWVLGGSAAINLRAARLHVLSDLGGSLAAVVAGAGIALTGWQPFDPLLSLVIVALVVLGAARLLRETLGILMEHTPPSLDLHELEAALREDPAVLEVHEMHAWTITSGFVAFAAHVSVRPDTDGTEVAARGAELLHQRFGLHHVTIQPEYPAVHDLAAPDEAAPPEPARQESRTRGT